jgi:hypothetical protein
MRGSDTPPPYLGQGPRHVDVEFMWRRKLAVNIAGSAAMTEIWRDNRGRPRQGVSQLHRREHRAKLLAIAAGVADRHQPLGFVGVISGSHGVPPPHPRFFRAHSSGIAFAGHIVGHDLTGGKHVLRASSAAHLHSFIAINSCAEIGDGDAGPHRKA